MVEYAMLVWRSSLESFAVVVDSWVSDIDWTLLPYAASALVVLRVAFWAFNSKH